MEETSLPEFKTMLLYFAKVSVSVAALAAYKIIVHSGLSAALSKAATSVDFKICQNLWLSFLSIKVFLACIIEQRN